MEVTTLARISAQITISNLDDLRALLLIAAEQMKQLQLTLDQVAHFQVQTGAPSDKDQGEEIAKMIEEYLKDRKNAPLKGGDKDARD